MLNHEGWSLLMILCALVALLLLALPHMGAEQAMAKRLTAQGSWMQTAAGTVLCACGVLVLAVVPSAVYRGGVSRLGLPVFCAAGLAVLLCVLVPRIKARDPQALTLCQALSRDRWTRVGLGALSAAAALVSAAAAVSMTARLFAYVFSLHYLIALGAAVGFALLLILLCGAQSRRAMDRLQSALLIALLAGAPAAAMLFGENTPASLQTLLQPAVQENYVSLYILTDLCAGIGALGLLVPAQTLFAQQDAEASRRGGRSAAICLAAALLLASLAGAAGRCIVGTMETIPASETVLMQIAELPDLPEPVSGLLTAALVTVLLLFAQAALRFAGMSLVWDVVQPLTGMNADRRLAAWMDVAACIACALTYPLGWNVNTPLAWYTTFTLLCGAVVGGMLLMRAFRNDVTKLGGRIGLAAGAAAVLVTLLIPVPEKWKLLGAVPAALAAVLPQWFVKDKNVDNESA